jgi:hypothetical protein
MKHPVCSNQLYVAKNYTIGYDNELRVLNLFFGVNTGV